MKISHHVLHSLAPRSESSTSCAFFFVDDSAPEHKNLFIFAALLSALLWKNFLLFYIIQNTRELLTLTLHLNSLRQKAAELAELLCEWQHTVFSNLSTPPLYTHFPIVVLHFLLLLLLTLLCECGHPTSASTPGFFEFVRRLNSSSVCCEGCWQGNKGARRKLTNSSRIRSGVTVWKFYDSAEEFNSFFVRRIACLGARGIRENWWWISADTLTLAH